MSGTLKSCLGAVLSSLLNDMPILIDLTYDIQSTDATTNLNVEEDLRLKDWVFDWRPALKKEHVLHDLRLLALAIDRKTKLVVFGLRKHSSSCLICDTQHVQSLRKHSLSSLICDTQHVQSMVL